MSNCIFCEQNRNSQEIVLENDSVFVIVDTNPVSPGHLLVIPKRHVVSVSELDNKEIANVFALLKESKEWVIGKYKPDGFNIGINEGEAAGQTIQHLHIHVIPRYKGDVAIPRGGVRHIIPGKGNYK